MRKRARKGAGDGQRRIESPDDVARHLLLEHLTDQEQAEFTAKGYVTVRARTGLLVRHLYRVYLSPPRSQWDHPRAEVREVSPSGRTRTNFCIYSRITVPPADEFLAHLLMLKQCPRRWRHIARAY